MNEANNHRIVVSRRGGPDVLQVVEEDLPEPGFGEVRVQVQAAGVSAYDLMVRSISIPGSPRPPFTPGEDIVGVVDKLGEGVSGVELGQRVAAWTFGDGSGYAEFVCRPSGQVVPVPSGVDGAEAVCMVVNYLTAHLYLHQTAALPEHDEVPAHAQRLVSRDTDGAPRLPGSGQDQTGGGRAHPAH